MKKIGGSKNFGWGKHPRFAGQQVIAAYYSQRFGSCRAHTNRWRVFALFMQQLEIKDVRDVTIETVATFGRSLRGRIDAGEMETSYASNLLTTVNITMKLLRGDSAIKVKPSKIVGKRNYVRHVAPAGKDLDRFMGAIDELVENDDEREAAVLLLARMFGLRVREACLLDTCKALEEAKVAKVISIFRGTKGGRGKKVVRHFPVEEDGMAALLTASQLQGSHSCLIPPEMSLIQFMNRVRRCWNRVRNRYELRKVHDLRAAAACDLYEKISDFPAPVMIQEDCSLVPLEKHEKARSCVSTALGHGDRRSAVSYIGSRRRR